MLLHVCYTYTSVYIYVYILGFLLSLCRLDWSFSVHPKARFDKSQSESQAQ